MTVDQIVVLVTFLAFVVAVLRGIRTQEAKDVVALANHRRARRALGQVHRATIQTPPTPRQGQTPMTHDAR